MSLYQTIAESLQYILPQFYKDRYFKNIKKLTKSNFSALNIEPEILWLKDFLSNDDVMLDVGANTGSFVFQGESKLLSKNIYAFEPNKELYNRLKRIFPNVKTVPIALSNVNEIAEFKIPIIDGKKRNTRGTLNTDFKEVNEESFYSEKVEVMKLDDWMSKNTLQRLSFIKIDVEGNEMKTLEGGRVSILKYKPTLMVEMEQRHHTENIWTFVEQIKSWGYSANYLDRTSFELEELTESILLKNSNNEKDKVNYINNIIFIPKQES